MEMEGMIEARVQEGEQEESLWMASASSSPPVEEIRAGEMILPRTSLFDLSNDLLISIFRALDLESLMKMACTAKRFLQVVQQDALWMELCRRWANLVDLPSWRARMRSGVDLYRLLRSLNNLSGLWTHKNCSPKGELLHVIWGSGGLEGWQVIPASSDDRVKFVKLFDVTGDPIGSDSVEAVFSTADHENRPDSLRLSGSGRLILPTASQSQFVLESHDKSSTRLTENSGVIRLGSGVAMESQSTLPSCHQGSSREGETWRKLFRRLKIGVPTLGQELRGLWTGLNGPYGWEIVAVTYSDDGFIVGTKVTGDPNVPSGEITFKGRLDSSVDFSTSDFLRGFPLPNQRFWFTKMYRGEGRIAQENFLNPIWVPGVLLQESSGLITFVWEFNNYRIRYRRLNLESSFRNWSNADASRAAGPTTSTH